MRPREKARRAGRMMERGLIVALFGIVLGVLTEIRLSLKVQYQTADKN
jgi:hypothetical protein